VGPSSRVPLDKCKTILEVDQEVLQEEVDVDATVNSKKEYLLYLALKILSSFLSGSLCSY
jgi:hypothetical protein